MVATPYFQLLLLLVVAVEVRILPQLEPLEKMVGQAAVVLGALVGQMLAALVTHHQLLHLKVITVVWEVVALVVILLGVVVVEQVLLAAQQQVRPQAALVALEPHLLFLVLQLPTLVEVGVLAIPQIPLEQAAQVEVVLAQLAQQTQLLELLIPEVVAVGQEMVQMQRELIQAQAVQALFFSNTQYLYLP
jgi:hypothetical protein